MFSKLMLITGIDIPFPELRVNIHQPNIKEISFIGEESFFFGCELLNFSKEKFLNDEDKINLESQTDFQVFMAVLKDQNPNMQRARVCVTMVLSLIFPEYSITFQNDCIALAKENEEEKHLINKENFEEFKEILIQMFCLKKVNSGDFSYNPGNDAARKIAERFKKAREKISEDKGESKEVSILGKYVSVLVTGQRKLFKDFNDYTVYQLYDEFERYGLKNTYDWTLKAKMAGAQDLDEVENWMKDIHSKNIK